MEEPNFPVEHPLYRSPELKAYENATTKKDDANAISILQSHPEIISESMTKMRNVLHIACVRGRILIVEYLLSIASDDLITHPSNEWIDTSKSTCLHFATEERRYDIVKLLLRTIIDRKLFSMFEYQDTRDCLAIHHAVEANDLKMMEIFREAYPSSFENSHHGDNLLFYLGDLKMMKYVLNLYPDWIHQRNEDGEIPFHVYAWIHNRLPLVKYCLWLTPQYLDYESGNGRTALHHSAIIQFDSYYDKGKKTDMASFLLWMGSQSIDLRARPVEPLDELGITPFELARSTEIRTLLAACSPILEEREKMNLSEDDVYAIRQEVFFVKGLTCRLLTAIYGDF